MPIQKAYVMASVSLMPSTKLPYPLSSAGWVTAPPNDCYLHASDKRRGAETRWGSVVRVAKELQQGYFVAQIIEATL